MVSVNSVSIIKDYSVGAGILLNAECGMQKVVRGNLPKIKDCGST